MDWYCTNTSYCLWKWIPNEQTPLVCRIPQTQNQQVNLGKRLSTWKCDNLSSGWKTILINPCLCSAPLYTIRVYLLYEGNYLQLDTGWSRFFWQGTSKELKHHIVKWEIWADQKILVGCLSWMSEAQSYECLLRAKWIDRLEREDNSICCELLRREYLGCFSILERYTWSWESYGSQYWSANQILGGYLAG